MGAPILSKEMFIQLDSSVLGFTTDFDLEINKEIIDITTLDSSGWMQKLVDLKSWSGSLSGLVTRSGATGGEKDFDALVNSICTSDASVLTAIKPTEIASNQYLVGGAFLSNLKFSGAKGGGMTYSLSFEGSEGLTISTV